ncbi:hypothetical protein HAX54_017104, partial [Datura stramonium]|nr:hypothetical protein [Datura stramonium]
GENLRKICINVPRFSSRQYGTMTRPGHKCTLDCNVGVACHLHGTLMRGMTIITHNVWRGIAVESALHLFLALARFTPLGLARHLACQSTNGM